MEKIVEEIEGSVRSLEEGQQAIVNQINDLFTKEQVFNLPLFTRGSAQIVVQLIDTRDTRCHTWEEFKTGIYATYGPHQFLDYFGELTKLRQQGTVQSYQFQFNKLLAKVGYLPQDRQPLALARLYEAKTQSQRKFGTGKSLCNEQYAPEHKCKKLFAIQAVIESSDDDEEMEIENQEPEVALISIHAVTGSTHNFVNSEFTKRVGLPIETNEKFKVKVASGESLKNGGQCKQVSLHVQGVYLITDFYLLALEGYDVVLGLNGLQT
ncbi:uncharacterized protein Tco_0286076 [Tanacetum coccineum]